MNDEHRPIGSAFDVGRSISNAFAAVRVAAGPLWLGGLLMWITDGCGAPGNIPSDIPGLQDDDDSSSLMLPAAAWARSLAMIRWLSLGDNELLGVIVGVVVAYVLLALVVGLGLFALGCWIKPGFIRLHVNVLENASDETAPLFSGKDVFWPMVGWSALDRLLTTAVAFIAAWPGALLAFIGFRNDNETMQIGGVGLAAFLVVPALIYVNLGTYLGAHAVVLEGHGPVRALRRTWALAQGNRLPLLWFAFVCLMLQAAGAMGLVLCCVGILATVPLALSITGFARTEGFLLFTRGMQAANGFKLWQRQAGAAQPPPDVGPPAGPAPGSAPAHEPAQPPRPDAPPSSATAESQGGPGVPRGWEGHLEQTPPRRPTDDDPEGESG